MAHVLSQCIRIFYLYCKVNMVCKNIHWSNLFSQNEAVHFARIYKYCKINKHLQFVLNHILPRCIFLRNIFTLQYLHFVLNHILPQCIFLWNIFTLQYLFAQNKVVRFARIYIASVDIFAEHIYLVIFIYSRETNQFILREYIAN